jgi:hypothetical protein
MSEPKILAKLQGVTRTSSGWSARCPAHDDEKPSLSVSVGDDGHTLVYCHAGCKTDAILKAVDMTFKDLGPERREVAAYPYHDERGARSRPPTASMIAVARDAPTIEPA